MEPVYFDTRQGGIGDMVTLCWLAEGYRHMGVEVAFEEEGIGQGHRQVIEMLGHKVMRCPWALPMQSLYHHEVNVTRGRVGRLEAWSALLPHRPEPRRPSHPGLDWAGADYVHAAAKERTAVVLFPSCTYGSRTWPAAYWIDLAWALAQAGVCVVGIDGEGGTVRHMPHYATGMGWDWVAGACMAADFVVGNDSGPVHVAATVSPKSAAMVGGPTKNVVLGYGAEEWHGARECAGCYFEAGKGFRAACDKQCRTLMGLEPEEVAHRVLERIGRASACEAGAGGEVQGVERGLNGG